MYVTHTLPMDLSGPAVVPKVDMVQRDQYVRKLKLELFSDGGPWAVPEDAHAIICYQKSDATGGEYDTLPDGRRAYEVNGNVLTVEIAPQMLTQAGLVRMAIDLLRGDAKISTFLILLQVQKAIPLGLPSGDYFKLEGFLSIPKKGEMGQLLRISGVSEAGQVTGVEGCDLTEALEEAKESGLFNGKSAYEVALDNGFEGTEKEWLESLKGKGVSAALGNIAQINITGQLTTDYNVIVDFNSSRLMRVKDPVDDTDGANKAYVDKVLGNLGDGGIPEYWELPLADVEDIVQTKLDTTGRGTAVFVWLSDLKLSEGETSAIGRLVARVADGCNAPLVVFSGGAAAEGLATQTNWRGALDAARAVFSDIGMDRVLWSQGITDGSIGTENAAEISKKAVYNAVFRRQEDDRRRVFGGDGTYYYIDVPTSKIRLAVLNCCSAQSGSTRLGFGREQLSWFADTALAFPEEGWVLAIVCHVPPNDSRVYDGDALLEILSAFEAGETYHAMAGTEGETGYYSLAGNFAGSMGAAIMGFFCGGTDQDEIGSTGRGFRLVTIRNAINRAAEAIGTTGEYALDIVTVNRGSGSASMTRLGAGVNRSFLWQA